MSIRWDHLPEYVPPPLPRRIHPERAFAASNLQITVTIVVVAISASAGDPGPGAWTRLIVVPVWLALLASGWWLCDTLTRSIHLLRGQRPSRWRVGRAWAAPALWVLLAELLVLSQAPTEVLDIRPAIAAVGFWVTAWRPFATMRRIFVSLTRLSHDSAVMAFGLMNIATWSLLWWLVHVLPESGIGIAWACALAAVGTAAIPFHLNRAYDQALAHRVLAIQTSEEHRYVRSLGLNPFHAGTYLELVMAKQERERRRGTSDPVAAVRSAHTLADNSDEAPERRPSTAWQNRPQGAEPTEAATERTTDHDDHRVENQAIETTGESEGPEDDRNGEERSRTGDSLTPPTNVPTLPGRPNDLQRRIREAAASAAEVMRADAEDSRATDGQADDELDPDEPCDGSIDTRATDGDDERAEVDDETALVGRGDKPTVPDGDDDDDDDDVSVAPSDMSVAPSDDVHPKEILPPRVTSLEAARYLSLLGLIAVAAAYGWLAIRSLDLVEPITTGRLSERDVHRIQRSVEWATACVTLMLPAQVLWVVMARVWIERAGRSLELRRSELFAAATVLISAATLALQMLGMMPDVRAALLVVAGSTCWICILLSEPVAAWDGRGPLSTRLWAPAVMLVAIVHPLVGFSGPVDPNRSIQVIAFVAVVLSLIAANTAIVVGVLTLEVVDRIRSSAIVARWHRARHETDGNGEDALDGTE